MAGKIKGITISLGADVQPLHKALADVNKSTKNLQSELKQVERLLKLDPKNTELLAQRQKILAESVSTTKEKLDRLKAAQEQVNEQFKQGKIGEEQYRAFQREVIQTEQSLKKMQGELDKATKELEKNATGAGKVINKLKELGDRAEKTGEKMSKAGETILKITAPVMAVGIAAGKMAMDFEEAMAKVSTIADTSIVTMDELEEGVLDLSDKYGMASKDVANALYEAISAGVDTAKVLGFIDAAIKNSVAGFTDVTTSVNTLTNVMNAYDIELERSLEISDKLIKVQKYGKTTIGQFGDEIGRAAPLAAQAGMSVEELFANIATLTKNSIKSNEALTATKAILSNIIKPSSEAAEEAERLGLRFDAAALKGLGFEKFLERVMLKTRGNTDSLVKLFGSVNALNAIMLLTSEKGSRDFREALDEINNSAGTTNEAFDKMNKTNMRYRQTLEQIKNALISLGEALLPVFEVVFSFVQVLTKVANILSGLSPDLVRFIFIFASLAAVVGTIFFTVGKFMTTFSTITSFLDKMNIGMSFTYTKILLIVAALVALAAILAVIMGRAGEVERMIKSIGNITVPDISQSIPQAGANQRTRYGYASGTRYHPGGLAVVGEEGPELVNLPRGSQVYSHRDTREILSQGGGDVFNITIDAKSVKEFNDIVRIAQDARRMRRMGPEPEGV